MSNCSVIVRVLAIALPKPAKERWPRPIDDEQRAIDEVVERISTRYPSLSRELIRDQVDVQLASFDGSTVRDFVPVLVERDTVAFLAEFAD